MQILILAGLAMAVEGAIVAASPRLFQTLYRHMAGSPDGEARRSAVMVMAIGGGLVLLQSLLPGALGDLAMALGLILVFEAVFWVFALGSMRQVTDSLAALEPQDLARIGALFGIAGLALSSFLRFAVAQP